MIIGRFKRGQLQPRRLAIGTLLGLIALAILGGCGGGGGGAGSSSTPALTENDFALDASMAADPERGVAVTLLESTGSAPADEDTGGAGVDVIPYAYADTVTNTFCWDDYDLQAGHVMTLVDAAGAEVLQVQANGPCVTGTIAPGEYALRLAHDNRSAETLAVFVEVLDAPPPTSLVGKNVDTLLRTNACRGCALELANLAKANLAKADLSGANLTGADLSDAILTEARLAKARLFRSTLTRANLSDADLSEVDLNGANLRQAKLSHARLIFSDLEDADLFQAALSGANLYRAHLPKVNLERANLAQVEFEYADLTGANLVEADLYGAGLARTQLVGADLTNADLTYANLCSSNLADAKFDGATLHLAVWSNCHSCESNSIGICIQHPEPRPPFGSVAE